MSGRELGIVSALEQLLPQAVRELFTVLTQLGDVWFLISAGAFLYWFGDRRQGAFSLAAILGSLALTLALKGLFGLPRPPASLQLGHASGHGFPSGHAIGATTLWALLAMVVTRGTHRTRALVAATVVAIVATSRVVIGVHYTVDVVAGVVVGLAYLGTLLSVTDWDPTRAFAVAGGIVLTALATNGLTADSVATFAGILGASLAWLVLDREPSGRVTLPVAAAGLGGLGLLGFAGNSLVTSLPAVFALNLLVPIGILALPVVVERAKKSRSPSPT